MPSIFFRIYLPVNINILVTQDCFSFQYVFLKNFQNILSNEYHESFFMIFIFLQLLNVNSSNFTTFWHWSINSLKDFKII